ncbi:MAG: hypothetical protein DWQ04_05485, partial [Chloroflexi bacterium]
MNKHETKQQWGRTMTNWPKHTEKTWRWRNLFILMTICAVLLGMFSQPGSTQAESGNDFLANAKNNATPTENTTDFLLTSKDGKQIDLYVIDNGTIGDDSVPIHTAEADLKYVTFTIADFDADGDHDFIAIGDDGDAYLFRQTTPLTFVRSRPSVNDAQIGDSSFSFIEGGITAADFNGDGYYDLAALVNNGLGGRIFINDGIADFEPGSKIDAYPDATSSVYAPGDVNEDGYIDLVTSSYVSRGAGQIYVSLNDGHGNLGYPYEVANLSMAGGSLAVGHFDNDNHLDIIAGQDDDEDSGQAYIFPGNGDGTFVDAPIQVEAYDTYRPDVGPTGNNEPGAGKAYPFDIDNDGIHDLVIAWDDYKHNGVYADGVAYRYQVESWKGNGDGTHTLVKDITSNTNTPVDYLASTRLLALPPIFDAIPLTTIADLMINGADVTCEGICVGLPSTQAWAGTGINTRNGNLSHQVSDYAIPVNGGALAFKRSYSSQSIGVYNSVLGHGWTHNYDMRLHINDDVMLQTTDGSRLTFENNGDGSFTATPGVTAELVNSGSDYSLTTSDQTVYTFNSVGLLQTKEDASGNVTNFTYNANAQLDMVSQGSRYLDFDYNVDGTIDTITDNIGRDVQFGYTNGNLTSVTDLLGKTTTYHYEDTTFTHHLTKVVDPSGVIIEETAYDVEGRAYQQQDGAGNLLVDIDRSQGDVVTVFENGVTMTHTYSDRNILTNTEYVCADGTPGCGEGGDINYDFDFNQELLRDANDNPTEMGWDGGNLTYIKDAEGNETFLQYNGENSLTQVTDADQKTTTYQYDNLSFPTFVTSITDARGKTTTFTPNTTNAKGLVETQTDPNGVVTFYQYNDFGQVTEVTQAFGTSSALTTSYGYDTIGRLITTTRTSATENRTDLTVYDDGNRAIAAIANWTGSDPTDWQATCDTSPGARSSNACTQYEYDDAGRVISTTNTLGQTDLSVYDTAGRPYLSVRNWDGVDAYEDIVTCDDLHNNTDSLREENLCTHTEYDTNGRVWKTTDVLGNVTLTEYDSVGRVDYTIINYVDGGYDENIPDEDIKSDVDYDAQGNVIVTTDTLLRKTRTFYDALNRVEGTIVNWDESTTLDGCALLTDNERDTNICTWYEYDKLGRQTVVTNALGQRSKTFYGPTGLVEGTIANWDGNIDLTGCVFNPLDVSDVNACTVYEYDDVGQRIITKNAVGQLTLTVYD